MNDIILRQKRARIRKLLKQTNEKQNVPEELLDPLVGDLTASDEVVALNKLFSSNQLTEGTKREFWNALYNDTLLNKLIMGWSLEHQANE